MHYEKLACFALAVFPAWEFLSNERMTLAHVWLCLQFLVHFQKEQCESEPHQTTKKINNMYLVQDQSKWTSDFPGVNTPLQSDSITDAESCWSPSCAVESLIRSAVTLRVIYNSPLTRLSHEINLIYGTQLLDSPFTQWIIDWIGSYNRDSD